MLCLLWYSLNTALAEWITKLGSEVLNRTDLVVEGVPLQSFDLQGGGVIIQFQIKVIYYGQIEFGRKISLIYHTKTGFIKGDRWVVFLKKMGSSSNFEAIGDFSVKDKEGAARCKSLERLITLELIPNQMDRHKTYLEYCLSGLTVAEPWVRSHAWQELEHLIATHLNQIDGYLASLEKIYPDIPDP